MIRLSREMFEKLSTMNIDDDPLFALKPYLTSLPMLEK